MTKWGLVIGIGLIILAFFVRPPATKETQQVNSSQEPAESRIDTLIANDQFHTPIVQQKSEPIIARADPMDLLETGYAPEGLDQQSYRATGYFADEEEKAALRRKDQDALARKAAAEQDTLPMIESLNRLR